MENFLNVKIVGKDKVWWCNAGLLEDITSRTMRCWEAMGWKPQRSEQSSQLTASWYKYSPLQDMYYSANKRLSTHNVWDHMVYQGVMN